MDMLAEMDKFCKKHHLRYSLAYGTLLGAVREKGFIPWDDDMDVMMPLPDMLVFKRHSTRKTPAFQTLKPTGTTNSPSPAWFTSIPIPKKD